MVMGLSELEQAVCESLAERRDRFYADLEEQVAISTGHNYQPGLDLAREVLTTRLQALGAGVTYREGLPGPPWLERAGDQEGADAQPIVIATHRAAGRSPRILLVGHLDTVHDPEGDFQELAADEDGVVARGPGAADMKGGLVIALAALEALRDHKIDFTWTFLLNADEETGSFGSEAVLREMAACHDVGIVLEPALADGSLALERMGSGQFMIEVFGRSAHVGREFDKGVSAVTRLGEVLVSLGALADPERGRIVNVGPVVGGSVTNAVPDYAACWGNLRYADRETGDNLAAKLDALATEADAMPRVVVHRHFNRPAKPATDAVRALANLARTAAEDLGQSLPFATTGGVCDGNILQDAGLPTIDTLGVRGGNLHRTDEFIEIPSLVERAQLLAVFLLRQAGP